MRNEARETFSSRIGIIAAAAGSAIGLGNIWKFPYITGEYGGAAFILVYLVCIAGIGLPVMISEFIIGRRSGQNAVGAFKRLSPGTPWLLAGWSGVVAAFLILSFYSVVAGWTLEYVVKSFSSAFAGKSPDQIAAEFESFTQSPLLPIFWQFLFLLATAAIVYAGIRGGIERYSKILMPILLGILILLNIRSLTLPGASAGIEFLLKPDFSALSAEAVLAALGHAFFTLSLGMGAMITYGSYIRKEEELGKTALQVTIADTAIALLAGFAIFPAVFAFGIAPESGPGLVFVTLPNVLQRIPLGEVFGVLFFLLLAIAALTSTISILEVIVAYLTEERKMNRHAAVGAAAGGSFLLSVPVSLSNGIASNLKIGGLKLFDLVDYLSANILLPLGGMLIAVFTGWYLKRTALTTELQHTDGQVPGYVTSYRFAVRFLAPVAIFIVFLNGIGAF